MEEKRVEVGSSVTVQIYLARLRMEYSNSGSRRHVHYERFREAENYKEVFILTNGPPWKDREEMPQFTFEIHPDSFIGRALLGSSVGSKREANVAGSSMDNVRIGATSGNHLLFEVMNIE